MEQSGTPVHNGTLVTFTTTLGTIDPREARTENGQVTARLTAGGESGTATIGAFSGGARADELEILIGGAAAAQVVLAASPSTVSAQGGSATLVALVTDEAGNGLPGVPVQFSTSAGTLSRSTVTTSGDGTARTRLTTTREATVTASAGGNQSDPVTVGVAAAPTVLVAADTDTPDVGEIVTFTVTVSPGAAGTAGPVPASAAIRRVSIEFGDGQKQALGALSGTTTVTHTYQSVGTKFVTVMARDAAGQTTSVSMVLTVQPLGVLSVILTASDSSPAVGEPVTFTATVTPAEASITEFQWSFGDGTSSTTTGGATSHAYNDDGTYTATVTVRATDGRVGTGSAVVAVQSLGVLSVILTAIPSSTTVGTSVSFTAVVTPSDAPVTEYSWNFGDGSTRTTTGNSTSHVYTAVGTYTVTVTVTAADGREGTAIITYGVS